MLYTSQIKATGMDTDGVRNKDTRREIWKSGKSKKIKMELAMERKIGIQYGES